MNKKTQIIFAIFGIVLVTLILLGLTYAYFVTQIEGNSSDKSIEVSTANLLLTYSDGNGSITANNIMPGTTTEEKIFTVKNNGNNVVSNYKVYLEDVINTFTNTSDVVINMTCTSSISNKTCNGLVDFTFPTTNDLLVSNSIDVGETQTYSLTVTYKETGVDQSVDMDKTFSGKIQIYDARNVVDISGTVSDAANGDYVEFHSSPKKSQINIGKEYKITGVQAGEHTLYIKSSNGSIKGSKTIVINRTNFISHEENIINVTNNTNEVKINVTDIKENLGIEINNIILNPYSDNSELLAYNIINNAQINKNRTTYEPNPITIPGKQINKVYSYEKDKYQVSLYALSTLSITSEQQNYYWTYSDKISVDENTGKFSLIEPKICKYNECYQNLKNMFVVSNTIANASSTTNEFKTSTGLTTIYQISAATISTMSLKKLYNIPDSAERTISKTEDDYGDTYYFRGDVKDNYINLNGMCFRIMRIEGDGSVKLILDDVNKTCDSESYFGTAAGTYINIGWKSIKTENYPEIYGNDFLESTKGIYNEMKKFQTNKMSSVLDKLKVDEWCYDNRTYSSTETNILDLTPYYQNSAKFYYYSKKRNTNEKKPTLKCLGTKLTKYNDGITPMYVGTFTADDISYAGGVHEYSNYNYYLINNWNKDYIYTWTMTPSDFELSLCTNCADGDYFYNQSNDGGFSQNAIFCNFSFRPSITLKSGIEITKGDGTQKNPYEIK